MASQRPNMLCTPSMLAAKCAEPDGTRPLTARLSLLRPLQVVEAELPDTLAALRLSGLELSDCLGELGGLTGDVGAGVRASARMVAAAEQVRD